MADTIKAQPKVIVFSTPTCSFCTAARHYFRQQGIKFRDVDVSRDPAARVLVQPPEQLMDHSDILARVN